MLDLLSQTTPIFKVLKKFFLCLGTINNGLIIMGLDVSEQMIVSGAIIVLAVAFGKKPNKQ